MLKKLYISLIFSNFVVEIKNKSQKNLMYNFCAKFRQILDICKCHSENLVNSIGNVFPALVSFLVFRTLRLSP